MSEKCHKPTWRFGKGETSFVAVAMFRFLLLAFVKAFNDRPFLSLH